MFLLFYVAFVWVIIIEKKVENETEIGDDDDDDDSEVNDNGDDDGNVEIEDDGNRDDNDGNDGDNYVNCVYGVIVNMDVSNIKHLIAET